MSPNGRIQNCCGSPRTGSCCSAAAAGLLLARVGLQLPLRWLVAAPRPLQLLQSSVCADTVWFKVLRKVGWDTALLSVPIGAALTLVVLVCWLIWKERNHRTFDHRTRTIEEVMYLVIEEITAGTPVRVTDI